MPRAWSTWQDAIPEEPAPITQTLATQPGYPNVEVMNVSDRILVMYEGEIVGELDPKKTNVQELGLYMSGANETTVKESKYARQTRY